MDIDLDKNKTIGIFRYGLIAPALHMSRTERRKYFSELSEKEFEVPYCGIKKYKPATFKNWLNKYRNGGLGNLMPQTRADAGISKKIKDTVVGIIKQIIEDFPYLSISGIYRMLIRQGHIRNSEFSENTLRYFIDKNKLKDSEQNIKQRKKFEKENVNELWTCDFMVGPRLSIGNKKMQVFLCGIIDDHSRMIVGSAWYFKQNCISLALTLKKAIGIYGICDTLFVDNGKVFETNYLHLICARLGIALVHSKPFDPASRAKIERWFRTVREKFLSCLAIPSIKDIEELNRLFEKWLDEEYHKQIHSGIEEKPIDRYVANASKIKIRTATTHELDTFFLNTITRKVKNDSTVSIGKTIYEVPVEFIGKKIELRFPIDKPDKITIYENDKSVCLIRKVNLVLNATKPYTGIHFKDYKKWEGEKND